MERKSKLQMIAVDKLHPHPQNPRKVIGDVTELAESIKANGILQNLTVVPNNDNWDDKSDFTVVIGHRRLAAAKQAGLTELPCAVVEMTEKEQLSTMLTENMQRSDLTVYEEAKGCQLLLDLGDTVAEVSEKTGFSETKIRRRVKLCELDEEAFKESQIRQPTLQDYDRLNQIKNIDTRNKLLKSIGTNNFDNLLYSAVQKQEADEKRAELEKICLDNGMTQCEGFKDIPENCKYTGMFQLEDLIGKTFDDGRKRYFFPAYGGRIHIYTKMTKKKIKELNAKEEKRIAKNQKFDEINSQIGEINERCKALREEFMREGNFNDDSQKQALINYILCSMSERKEYNEISFCALSGLKYDDNNECINLDDCIKDTGKMLMSAAYAFFKNWRDNSSYILVDYADKTITRKINPELNRFYNLLVKLGYVMSDEEIQLRDGTHPIFTTGEVN